MNDYIGQNANAQMSALGRKQTLILALELTKPFLVPFVA